MWGKGEEERKGGKEGVKRAEEREETKPRFLCIKKKMPAASCGRMEEIGNHM